MYSVLSNVYCIIIKEVTIDLLFKNISSSNHYFFIEFDILEIILHGHCRVHIFHAPLCSEEILTPIKKTSVLVKEIRDSVKTKINNSVKERTTEQRGTQSKNAGKSQRNLVFSQRDSGSSQKQHQS